MPMYIIWYIAHNIPLCNFRPIFRTLALNCFLATLVMCCKPFNLLINLIEFY